MPVRFLVLSLAFITTLAACRTSTHATRRSELGVVRRSSDLIAVLETPGPLTVETVASADWAVARSGLVNLEHPTARAAQLHDGDEPIQIYFHAIRHPSRGTFVVDTGVERNLRDAPDRAVIRGFVARAMNVEKMKIHQPLGDWLAQQASPLAGVLFTHLHADHVMGLPDVPRGTPLFTGPGETSPRAFMNLVVQGVIDEALEGQEPLSEFAFEPDADGRFAGVVDVFGDGSLWALWMPGHTPGSVAYLARTTTGPVLFAGDTCHTAWGWTHDVEPGEFTADHAQNAESLARLRALVAEHPSIDVRLGHQPLE